MIRSIQRTFVASLVILAAALTSAQAEHRVRVATYNIKFLDAGELPNQDDRRTKATCPDSGIGSESKESWYLFIRESTLGSQSAGTTISSMNSRTQRSEVPTRRKALSGEIPNPCLSQSPARSWRAFADSTCKRESSCWATVSSSGMHTRLSVYN